MYLFVLYVHYVLFNMYLYCLQQTLMYPDAGDSITAMNYSKNYGTPCNKELCDLMPPYYVPRTERLDTQLPQGTDRLRRSHAPH